ncbi:cupin domain-containing protein [Paenibacillus sp. AN1007]|uniref:Cupin domain-containing protein n=1 Tax=Paenibacillus sp. AN1007 TaxID=3151385 RepID=A0AAU8NJV8_9BACL
MEFYRFDQEVGMQITKFDSNFVMSRLIQTSKDAHIGCMHLPANGVVGYHQAVSPQLMIIMSGEGQVRSGNGNEVRVKAGEAVFWAKEEWHETKTAAGLTAIVIESDELTPAVHMPVREPISE